MKKTILTLLILCTGSLTAMANTTMFFDDFNQESIGLKYNSFSNWNVVPNEGTVDVIGVGSGWNYFPDYGRYVDMDGSSGDAGIIETKAQFNLVAGVTYQLSFDLAGNQRGSQQDAVTVQVNMGDILNSNISLAYNAPFQNFVETFSVADNTSATISFAGFGGDNVGMLLDNVKLEAVNCPAPAAVPAPGAILLGSLGSALAGMIRKRIA